MDNVNVENVSVDFEDCFKEINQMVGLENVKKEIRIRMDFIKEIKHREKEGMNIPIDLSYHMVFTGNPGTGKTTVARMIGKIYKSLGILSKGHLVEADRSRFVARYEGLTAEKTNKLIDSALGGVLFIDEAYTLIQDGNDSFGREAIETLLVRMENDRSNLVVIFAGYSDRIKDFINSNQALESRFNTYIEFEDYTTDELMQIFESMCNKYELSLTEESKDKVSRYFDQIRAEKYFGNGRDVRRLFDKIYVAQVNRVIKLTEEDRINNPNVAKNIEPEDIESVF